MATLTLDRLRPLFGATDPEEYPVIASDIIYSGAAVGENGSGFARPLVAGDRFLGFAYQQANNSAGAAGAINVKVYTKGVIQLPIASLAITANDRPVLYASDDDTFTLTSTNNSRIGTVRRFISTGLARISFDADYSA